MKEKIILRCKRCRDKSMRHYFVKMFVYRCWRCNTHVKVTDRATLGLPLIFERFRQTLSDATDAMAYFAATVKAMKND